MGDGRSSRNTDRAVHRPSAIAHPPSPIRHPVRTMHQTFLTLGTLLVATTAVAQTTNPYTTGLRPDDVAVVGIQEFAQLPDIEGVAARMMLLAQEPGSRN